MQSYHQGRDNSMDEEITQTQNSPRSFGDLQAIQSSQMADEGLEVESSSELQASQISDYSQRSQAI